MAGSRYHRVKGLEKGLGVLRALNRLREASAAAIATATDLPRPTAHRLLETLNASGYVTRGRIRGTYRLAPLIRALSEGYRDDDWICDIAEPILRDLSDEIVWPADIATYENGAMVIRTSTHHRSPLSLHRAITGTRFPMLSTSIGLAYLAFSPERERNAILELLARAGGPDAAKLRGGFDVGRAIADVRARGYGARKREKASRTASIAVPVRDRRRVLACLNVVWIDAAISTDAAVARYLPLMKKAARRIEVESRQFTSQAP